ncbi:GNAT family N-acetyltransferase [Actinokineospora iranica]|uniref:Predicted acetyltransferase n=1 Tax=Actinokineospora iranica TaxID=1271860 RepID=A0A1G6LJ37_9PSEU|nr:GNAT family N-acetyltransferase [Actinokineospora iranica]SDC42765.1 Predicted acetyltransferase [Actinokineospora iranica]
MSIDLAPVHEPDKPVLANLLQFYLHDFAEIRAGELTPHGTFVYRYLDSYFTEPAREAYLITVAGALAGFAMARGDVDPGCWNVAEFFVARGRRRSGVGRGAARRLFSRHPGEWTLSVDHDNAPAMRFWQQTVAGVAEGPVIRTDQHPPEVDHASTRLRFRVRQPRD